MHLILKYCLLSKILLKYLSTNTNFKINTNHLTDHISHPGTVLNVTQGKYLFLGSGERQYKLTTQKRKKPPSSLPNYRSNIDTCLIHFSTVARRLVFICFVGGIEVAFVLYLKYHNLKFILWQGFSCSMYHSLSSVEKEKYCIKQCN